MFLEIYVNNHWSNICVYDKSMVFGAYALASSCRSMLIWLVEPLKVSAPTWWVVDNILLIQETIPPPAEFPQCQPLPPNPYPPVLNPQVHAAYDQCLQHQVDAGDDVGKCD